MEDTASDRNRLRLRFSAGEWLLVRKFSLGKRVHEVARKSVDAATANTLAMLHAFKSGILWNKESGLLSK
jgi:hypothetical protein